MAFNPENRITWEELAPSLQELFKNLQSQITKEVERALSAEKELREQLIKLAKEIDLVRGAAFKSWAIKLWENHHIFTDLSFYETHDVQQSGSNNRISDKRYNCIFGIMYGPNITIQGEHPGWIKHQQVFTGPDGVTRIYLGVGVGMSASIYRSDDQGLTFNKVATIGGRAIWDFVDASSIGAGLLCCTYDPYAIYRSTDGVNWTKVASDYNTKTLILFNGRILAVTPGTTYYSTNGVNWSAVSGNGVTAGYSYSRYYGQKVYLGTANGTSGGRVYVSTDANGFYYTLLKYPNGTPWSTSEAYVRWIVCWTPVGYNSELIIWGTGFTQLGEGYANLWCYDPSDGSISLLYSFNGRNDYNKTAGALNYGHAPIEPMLDDGNGNFYLGGFREAQIRYIEPFYNDYTGETFLLVGTSDCHFYEAHGNKTLYYQTHDYNTHTSVPATRDDGVTMVTWSKLDKEAWKLTDTTHIGADQYGPYMGNVYAVSPRKFPFRKDDLCIALIKHTEDTRVYSMCTFTDPQGIKWAYAGTGGGNYSGKGLLYRFGYSDMLNLISAAKLGAIFPPRWSRRGTGNSGVNTALVQDASRAYIKIMGGISAREDYVEIKFGFMKNFLKSAGTNSDPYIRLIFNHEDAADYYCITYYPLLKKVVCENFIGGVSHTIPTLSGNSYFTTPAFDLWESSNEEEGSTAPNMGPYYIMAAKVNPGAINPDSTSSADYYKYNSLDGSVDFYFKESQNRQDKCDDGDKIASYTIDYPNENKHIGNYGLESFDINGLIFVSMHQMSLGKYQKDAMEVGEIVFTVS